MIPEKQLKKEKVEQVLSSFNLLKYDGLNPELKLKSKEGKVTSEMKMNYAGFWECPVTGLQVALVNYKAVILNKRGKGRFVEHEGTAVDELKTFTSCFLHKFPESGDLEHVSDADKFLNVEDLKAYLSTAIRA